MMKFFSAIAILAIALILQFWFASADIYLNLALAVLIALAFTLDFWEILFCALLSVFLLNWQPAPSVALALFLLIPLGAYGFRNLIHWELWIGSSTAIFVGLLIFSLVLAPTIFFANAALVFIDIIAGLVAGETTLFALR